MTDWEQDMQRMGQTMRDVAATSDGGCVLVAGDFNGTLDMLPFRELLEHGYGDAVEQAGAGLAPTYPANSRLPPLIAIDHVLTHRCTAISVERTELPGSDHKGLKTVIDIPRSG
jgi:endonuclease/exonuclease/phosphatase (EEP) superfamily protein YafD